MMPGVGTGTGLCEFVLTSPGLFTLTVPDGWTPGTTGRLYIVFTSTEPGLTAKDVNAVVTVTLQGSAS